MSRVLVTGGSGFVGRQAVVALAAAGLDVVVATRGAGPPRAPIRHRTTDLLAPGAVDSLIEVERPTHLLHLAWETTHGRYWTAPDNWEWLRASKALLRAFFDAGGLRAVVTGTCAEYDWGALGDAAADERSTALAATTPYAKAKLALSENVEHLSAEGASAAWCRLFFPFGRFEGPQRFVPAVTRALVAGLPAEMTAGGQIRDFMDVRDVGRALAAVLLSNVTGPINIASGEGTALVEIATELARQLGREALLRPGALPTQPKDPPYLVGANMRLRTEVGFSPRIPLSKGLADAIEFWRGALQAPAIVGAVKSFA